MTSNEALRMWRDKQREADRRFLSSMDEVIRNANRNMNDIKRRLLPMTEEELKLKQRELDIRERELAAKEKSSRPVVHNHVNVSRDKEGLEGYVDDALNVATLGLWKGW